MKLDKKAKIEYVKMVRGERNADYQTLLSYAFYLLITNSDELSLNFAYSIILQYTKITKDFKPLTEFSVIFGFSPVLKILLDKEFKFKNDIENLLMSIYITNNKYKDKILTSGQKIIYRLIGEDKDYSVVAPTSYGKTDLMIESVFNTNEDVIIIVPLVALLSQVKSDIHIYAKQAGKEVKVITHHDIKPSETRQNVYVLTQERCYQTIKKNGLHKKISCLFIDESHKLLVGDKRSLKLSEIIFLLKRKYGISVKYYSPVLYDANSIKIKGLYAQDMITIQNIRDVKNYNYYFFHQESKKLYLPKTETFNRDYIVDSGYKDYIDYIIKNSKKKNIVYLNSPNAIENEALWLSSRIGGGVNINKTVIRDFVGDEYYIMDTLSSGVIYIHSQMPEIVRFYLLDLYRKNNDIKYIVTNSSILEGVNTPSDNLFILDYNIGPAKMRPIEFINLRGRINRIADMVKEKDIFRLICDVHFIVGDSNAKLGTARNEIIDPCYEKNVLDYSENLFLEQCIPEEKIKKEEKKEDFINSITKISLIDKEADIEKIFKKKLRQDLSDEFIKSCLMNDVILSDKQLLGIRGRVSSYENSKINTIKDLLDCIEQIFDLKNSDFYQLSRLSNEKAKNFYSMFMNWLIESKTIKEKVGSMMSYYAKVKQDELIYVGSRGEICAEMDGEELTIRENGWSRFKKDRQGKSVRLKKVWIKNNKETKVLYNSCVVKIKIEEDFISYFLTPLIETLYEFKKGIITEDLYNLIKYGTTSNFEILLAKEGFSPYLARALNKKEYLEYISLKEGEIKIDNKILNVFNENEILKSELALNIY